MSYFNKAIVFVLRHEGGYVNDLDDMGGETNFGITKRQYPKLNIKDLTKEEAIEIYRRDYWRNYMDLMPYPIAAKLFDCSVNMGHTRANILLQRAAGVIDDGVIGHNTTYAINKDSVDLLMTRFINQIKKFYDRIIEKRPTQVKFKKGWYKRAEWNPIEEIII